MAPDLSRRIAITGAGAVGVFGLGTEALWSRLDAGDAGFAPCTRYSGDLPCAEAGETGLAAPVAVRPALAGVAGVAVRDRGCASGAGTGRPPRRQGGGGSRHRHRIRHVERTGRDYPGDLRRPDRARPRGGEAAALPGVRLQCPGQSGEHPFRPEGADPGSGRRVRRPVGSLPGADVAGASRRGGGDRDLRGRVVRGHPVRPAGSALAPAGRRSRRRAAVRRRTGRRVFGGSGGVDPGTRRRRPGSGCGSSGRDGRRRLHQRRMEAGPSGTGRPRAGCRDRRMPERCRGPRRTRWT